MTREWQIYPVTFKRSEIDAMTLEDFGDSDTDEETLELLRKSTNPLSRRMASPDPEIRLAALKEYLEKRVTVIEDQDD